MNIFVVTVACAVGMLCPLSGPMKHEYPAKSAAECRSAVLSKIAAFGQDTKKFSVKCDQK